MEERLKKLGQLYVAISNELQQWLREEVEASVHPAAYSVDNAMRHLRESDFWVKDAYGQVQHFEREVKPQLDATDGPMHPPKLEVK